MENLSLKERFENAKLEKTPAQKLVEEICELTKRKDATVRRWLYGLSEPDNLVKELLAEHFKTDVESLFPNN